MDNHKINDNIVIEKLRHNTTIRRCSYCDANIEIGTYILVIKENKEDNAKIFASSYFKIPRRFTIMHYDCLLKLQKEVYNKIPRHEMLLANL